MTHTPAQTGGGADYTVAKYGHAQHCSTGVYIYMYVHAGILLHMHVHVHVMMCNVAVLQKWLEDLV